MGIETQREKRKWLQINTKAGELRYKEDGEIKVAPAFTGRLEDIQIQEKEYEGKPVREMQLHFNDAGEKYAISVNADTGIANNILNTLLNIDEIGELTIGVFLGDNKAKPGEKQCAVWIKNNGEKTNGWKYKKDENGKLPEGFPEPIQTQFKGKTMWDFSPVANFLWEQTQKVTIPKLKGAGYVASNAAVKESGPAAEGEIDDDLPF